VLTVLDGWGYRAETKGNAIALARKPAYDELIQKFPNTLIHTSGPYVGLPEGQMGNSEVGHMNMGAGRIVHMDITRIDLLIANKQLQNVPLFQQAMERGRRGNCILWIAERRRRALAHSASICVAGDGEAAKSGKSVCALFHGRTRHAAEQRAGLRAQVGSRRCASWEWGKLRRWWDGITRWTATTAGSAWSLLIARWFMASGNPDG